MNSAQVTHHVFQTRNRHRRQRHYLRNTKYAIFLEHRNAGTLERLNVSLDFVPLSSYPWPRVRTEAMVRAGVWLMGGWMSSPWTSREK